MFQDEPALIGENISIQDLSGDLRDEFQVIGWICKYDVIARGTVFDKSHGIRSYYADIIRAKGVDCTMQEPGGFGIVFDHIYTAGPA